MQTFVPSDISFEKCAQLLDYRRLGKQRVEAFQILNALEGVSDGWANHPATLMWQGHEAALRRYLRAMIKEWIGRGYNNTMKIPRGGGQFNMPWWWGGRIHTTHRAALLAKDDFYKAYGWTEEPKIDYFWPSIDGGNP